MPSAGIKNFLVFTLATFYLFTGGAPALAQRNAHEIKPVPMKRPPPNPNAAHWHSLIITPKPGLPEIHFYDKFNPVWWLQNADDPIPPAWYKPDDKHRATKWRFRNPFHNFSFYVIGVADKEIVRSGRYPERNSDPNGGWDFAVARRKIVPLPFISYDRNWLTFYLGWREHGAFGAEMKFHRHPKPPAAKAN
jgi:hypothetical protein